jgi:hypothetical protein
MKWSPVMKKTLSASLVACLALTGSNPGYGWDEAAAKKPGGADKPTASSPDEPLAKTWSPKNSADYLGKVSTAWLTQRKCAACHTSYTVAEGEPIWCYVECFG